MVKKKEFSYVICNGQQVYDDPESRRKFFAKKTDDFRGYESHRKESRAKSNPQLGYYWGLLNPEITKQLNAEGWTITVGHGEHSFEREYTEKDTHEWLKKYAANLGEGGSYVTLSEQDEYECSMFITNVLRIAERWLKMNREALEAKRPAVVVANIDETPPDTDWQ
jgi:hypothetical protein